MVECYHYLVLLVSKFFHPEEACFLNFYCVGGVVVGWGGGRITFLHFGPCWDHFCRVYRAVRCGALRGNDFKIGLSTFEAIFEGVGPKYTQKLTLFPKLVPVI